jgi:hypothetical protein
MVRIDERRDLMSSLTPEPRHPGIGSDSPLGRADPDDTERDLQIRLAERLEAARERDPEWWSRFEDTDIETCPRAELVSLMHDAPTGETAMFLFGHYRFRLALEAITDRGFQ